ncbi:ATP-dependent zinc metalloprotease FtsH, partial [Operophtera brumata]
CVICTYSTLYSRTGECTWLSQSGARRDRARYVTAVRCEGCVTCVAWSALSMSLSTWVRYRRAVYCGYPPTGDEVQAGSVLLPASRRGRYLANIVRRQAVMNAEAKKKVDVLSEELLPYIIAEQERRTTLYKRVMTAIQNGEKGVTVAEIRNKPPLIIRKGHKMEGPDLPRNGTTVIGCAPLERTSLNYTTQRCALEDTDDVVVHYRYYPD